MTNEFWNRPCAAPGLLSYRYVGRYGYIMIGARDNEDAMREVKRSQGRDGTISLLEIWDGARYVPVACELGPLEVKIEWPSGKPYCSRCGKRVAWFDTQREWLHIDNQKDACPEAA